MQITPLSKIEIFVSYRRDDTAIFSGRIFEYLKEHFRKAEIYKDIFSMKGGDRIKVRIEEEIGKADVFLLVIGKNWTEIQRERLKNISIKEDLVHYEISAAIKKKVIIIPVLVEGASMPEKN